MKKILVGFDGSEGAQQALTKAQMLIDEDGELVLLAVIPRPEDKTFLDEDIYKDLKQKAQQLITNAINTIGTQMYTITGMVEEGDAAATIIDIANKLECDLIVLGGIGTSAIGRYLLGSVANKVVQYAHKPVMVVR
jgi:nucleotide-binding universal stress UspA family protein